MNVPPGSRLPAALQTAALIHDPLGHLDRSVRRYGDVFTGRYLGLGEAVWVADPESVKNILSAGAGHFVATPNGVLEFLVGRNSVFTVDASQHRRKRRFLLPAFHGEAVARHATRLREI